MHIHGLAVSGAGLDVNRNDQLVATVNEPLGRGLNSTDHRMMWLCVTGTLSRSTEMLPARWRITLTCSLATFPSKMPR